MIIVSELEEYKKAEALYNDFRSRFYDHLSRFNSWDEYRTTYLSRYKVRFDKSEFTEEYLRYFYSVLTERFLDRNKFLRPYALPSKDSFVIPTTTRMIKIRVELYNIKREDLFYPFYLECLNVHSARHSLAMFLKEGVFNQKNAGRQFALYMRPLLTYPGDKEYTLYYLSLFDFPTVILTRLENLAWLLQVNGLMKIGVFGGRWCSRIFKVEPATLFYKEFFWAWQYKLSKSELVKYCEINRIPYKTSYSRDQLVITIENYLKTPPLIGAKVTPPNKNKVIWNQTKYPLYRYNATLKEWAAVDTITNEFPKYEPIVEMRGTSKRFRGWRDTGEKLRVDNLIQLIAINKWHSGKRKVQNPNMSIAPLSNVNSNFLIYQYYPLYEETPKRMFQLIQKSPISIKPNPYEVEHPILYDGFEHGIEETEQEHRFGCIICPYKTLEYYRYLKEHYPFEYFYCLSVRLIASARTILEEGREYWYEGKDVENPIMCSKNIM